MEQQLEIGGKRCQMAGEGTARHDMFTMRQIAACGLNVVRQNEGEPEDLYMHRLYLTALKTGDIFKLLGGLVVPEGTEPTAWTEKMAGETAEYLANLTEPTAKAKVRILLASALTPFFAGGLRSSKTFRKSSPHPESDRPLTVSAAQVSTAIGV
jgi:hypothetical protein